MNRYFFYLLVVISLQVFLFAAAKPKAVNFGRWLAVQWMVGPAEQTTLELKVRALLVNGEAKFFSTGAPHDVTDKIFIVREAHRLNDMLPSDTTPKWKWHPGGWTMVNRSTARISKVNLPEFDSYYSEVSWYRDLAAYCGVTDNEKLYAMVVQIGRRKPIVKKLLGQAKLGEMPNSECAAPTWIRQPMRVFFAPAGGEKVSFNVRGQSVEVPADSVEEPEDPQ